jgi:hypothetical protein
LPVPQSHSAPDAADLVAGSQLWFPQLNEKLHPEYAITRLVVEDKNYLDCYYGPHRLFREGARPEEVILALKARQIVARDVHGDSLAQSFMDRRDLLRVRRTIATDNTVISNLLFANLSRFYGMRSEVHQTFPFALTARFPRVGC